MELRAAKRIFRAFSDETRLRILNLLSRGELCVCDVMRVLEEPQSKISRHLAYLKRTGLVAGRKEGLWMIYRLSAAGARAFRSLIAGACGKAANMPAFHQDFAKLVSKKSKLAACCG